MSAAAARVAIVGICGGMGQSHARALRALGAGVVAGVDTAATLGEVCAAFGAEPVASHRDLAARRDVDLVIVSTPPALHPQLAADLLEEGLPVLCEKPVALRLADALRLAEVARGGGFFMAGHVMRFDPAMRALRELIRAGTLGVPRLLSARKCWPAYTSWRLGPGGGAVMIKDVHYWDLVPWLLDAAPTGVYAAGGDLFHGAGVEDAYHLTMRFSAEVVFHLESAWWTPRSSVSAFEVVGTEARAVVGEGEIGLTDREGRTQTIRCTGEEMLRAELRACLDAARARVEPPCTLRDGLRAVAIGEAVAASLRTGEPVPVAPYLEAVP